MKDYSVLDELVPKTEELHKAIDKAYEQGYRDGHNDYAEINKDVYDEAYQKGIEEGSADAKILIENAYRKGLDDAWECSKMIVLDSQDGGIKTSTLSEIFNMGNDVWYSTFKHFTASEAIEKIKAWEQKGDIKVGDEVSIKNTNDFVVVSRILEDGTITGFGGYGQMYSGLSQERVTKTGNHYDGIEKILKKVRGE